MTVADDKTRKAVLRWVAKGGRYHLEASSRWGHHYQDLVLDGLIAIGPVEVFIRGRFRDTRTPISLSDEASLSLHKQEARA